jgi:F420-non-reducing hydrogenase small subunit
VPEPGEDEHELRPQPEERMAKLKLASYWASACGGCDVAILDTHEKILDIAAAADIVFWPIALDFKYEDVIRGIELNALMILFNARTH